VNFKRIRSKTSKTSITPIGVTILTLALNGCNAFDSATSGTSAPNNNEISTVPSIPTELSAIEGSSKVYLSWKPSTSGKDPTYNIRRSTSSNGAGAIVVASQLPQAFFVDSTVTNDVTYFYTIEAQNDYGLVYSTPISVTPKLARVTFANSTLDVAINNSNKSAFDLHGTCAPYNTIVKISGSMTYTIPCNNGTWSKIVDASLLADSTDSSTYPLYADLTDQFGTKAPQASVSLIKKTTLPALALSTPYSFDFINSINNSATYPITGTCSEEAQKVTIRVDGASAAGQIGGICSAGQFSASIDSGALSEGTHTLTAVYSDVAGNIATAATSTKPLATALAATDSNNNRVLIWKTFPNSTQQAADIVIGQPSMTTNTGNNGGLSASAISNPRSVSSDGIRLAVVDANNNRVLIWNSIPTTNKQSADVVLGQPSFTSSTPNNGGVSAKSLSSPARVVISGNRLVVSDQNNSRVLIWNSIPTSNFQSADLVIGQPSFSTATPNNGGTSASSFGGPIGISTNGTSLAVADNINHRVLIWNTFPSVNGKAADVVLGQPNFTSSTFNNGGVSASTLRSPTGVTFVGSKLFVADQLNNRMLLWNTTPSTNKQPADVVIGQPDFATVAANSGGLNSQSNSAINGATSDGRTLALFDPSNHRALFYKSIPTSNYAPADFILGQPNFTSASANRGGVSSQSFNNPGELVAFSTGALPAGIVITKDSINPTVSIASPTLVSVINATNSPSFTVSGSCAGSGGSIVVTASSGAVSTTPNVQPICTSGSFTTTLNLSSFPDGAVTFGAVQTDRAGNVGSSSVQVIRDTSADAGQTTLAVAPSTLIANGSSTSTITVTVKESSGVVLSGKTVTLLSSRGSDDIVSPSSATTNASGIATFTIKSTTGGTSTLTATVDSISMTGTVKFLSTQSVASMLVTGYPAPQMMGTSGSVTVTALDAFGATVAYTGTVTFSSTDSAAVLPSSYAFTASDNGTKVFTTTLNTMGTHSITVTESTKNVAGSLVAIRVLGNFSASYPFTFGSDSQYSFNGARLRLNSNGAAELRTVSQTDNSSALFSSGTLSGLTWDSGTSALKLDPSTSASYVELDPTWTPAYSNIVGYWKLNGTVGSIASGATVSSVTGGNLTAFGTGLSYASGQLNQGVQFNGSTTYLASTSSFDGTPTGNSARTLAAWVYPTSATLSTIVSTGNGDCTGKMFTMGRQANGYVRIWGGCYDASSTNLIIPANVWSFVVLSYDGTNVTIHVNDQSEIVARGAYAGVAGKVFIGAESTNNGTSVRNYFNGIVDEVAVWNTALTTAQVRMIYQHQSSKFAGSMASRVFEVGSGAANNALWSNLSWIPTLPFGKALPSTSESTIDYSGLTNSSLMNGIVGLWHLDETTGTTFADSSGQNNTGTMVGSVGLNFSGKFNKATSFSGSGSWIKVSNANNIPTGNSARTVMAWIYDKNSVSGWGNIVSLGSGTANNTHFGLSKQSGKLTIWGHNNDYHTTLSIPQYQWTFVAVSYDGAGTLTSYVNGNSNTATGRTYSTTNSVATIGVNSIDGGTSGSAVWNGLIDEVAIYNRALSAVEIQQIYQRGASRLMFQVRSCASNPCNETTEPFKGPDGTNQTYFSELNNTDTNLNSGSIQTSLPNMVFSAFAGSGLTVGTNRYFQYKALFETDYATDTSLGPQLKSVFAGPNHYNASGPAISNATGVPFYEITNITETFGAGGCSGGVRYQLSNNNAQWYFWNGAAWSLANSSTDYEQANSTSVIQSNLSTFSPQVGSGSVYFRAFLLSNGNSPCQLDAVDFTGTK
jgi:trimeric autotransporter adhesin